MPATTARTYFDLKKLVARLADDLVRSGTATGGSATTIVDTVNFIDATDTALKGVWWYIGNGPRQGSGGRATAFTPSTDTLTIPSGTAITSSSEYMLTRRFSPDDIQEAIRLAVNQYGKYANPWVDQSLIYGSPLLNATFYDNSGTFPNGWSRTGTGGAFTQQATVVKHGRFSCQITSDGSNAAGISQDILAGPYRGQSLELRCWVWTTAASRVSIAIADGITTQTSTAFSTTNRGWGTQELSSGALTISDRATEIRCTCDISSGSGITARFSGIWVKNLSPLANEWNMPAGTPNSLHEVNFENGRENMFDVRNPAFRIAEIVRETTRRIRLQGSGIRPGSIIELVGRNNWADFTAQTTDDDTNLDGDWSWVAYEAAANLTAMKLSGAPEYAQRLGFLRQAAVELRRNAGIAIGPPRGSVLTEWQ